MKRTRRREKRKEVNEDEKDMKKWIYCHDPKYVERRKEYAALPEVKEYRSTQSKKRRQVISTIVNFCRNNTLLDEHGNSYRILGKTGNRLVRTAPDGQKTVVRYTKKGEFVYQPFETVEELEDEKFDIPIEIAQTRNTRLKDNVKKLLNGDKEIEAVVKKKKIVVPADLTEEEMYWRKLTDVEKKELLEKFKV